MDINFPFNECKIVNVMSFNLRASITEKETGAEDASGVSEKFFSLLPQ